MTDERTPSTLERLSEAVHMTSLANQLTETIVREARKEGYSWTQIGDAIGITRQGASQRFSFVDLEEL